LTLARTTSPPRVLTEAERKRRRQRQQLRGLAVLGIVVISLVKLPVGLVLASLWLVFVVFRRTDLDATTVLTLFLLCLTLVPARYVVPALGAAGTPAAVIAVGCLYWWLLDRVAPRSAVPRDRSRLSFQPVRIALAVFGLTMTVSFIAAFAHSLNEVESNGAVRGMIAIVGMVGVGVLAADGIRSRARFEVLLNRVLNLAAVMAIIGCVQFFTDFDPVVSWRLPGLELSEALTTVVSRSVVSRVASTTLHPIEFGALIAMLFPLALQTAMFAEREKRVRRWARLGLITFAIPLSVSRTAVVVLLIVVAMMWTAWSWRRRLRLVVVGFVFVMAMRALVRGLLGTIIALFTNFGNDPSTKGRTADYTRVWSYVGERPWFGRGLGTFDPSVYFFLDNQILMTLVTGGIIGLIGLVGLVTTGASVARQVYWHGHDEATRHLGAALAAGIVAGFCGFYTFDSFAFPVFIGTWFLLVGMAGALWRLDVAPHGRTYANPRHRALADAA
jgi:hypothetical protein